MKPAAIVSLVIVGVLVAGGYLFYQHQMESASRRKNFNQIIARVENAGPDELQAVARDLEALDPAGDAELQTRIQEALVRVYTHLGDNPEFSLRESARWYRKALELDADALDERQQKALSTAEKMPVD